MQCHCVAAHVDLQRRQTKTSHTFDIFIRHMWMPCAFVAQTHHTMDGDIMWYTAQRLFWTFASTFTMINHYTHCAFCCQLMANELMIHTFTYTDAVRSQTTTIFQVLGETLRISFTDGAKTACHCFSINPYPTAFPYGNGMVLHFYQQQESSTTKTVHKVINKGLKTYV